jgi:hypothetical protein
MLPDAGIAGPVASANAASATPKGGNQDHMVIAPPKTCPWAGSATRDPATEFQAWQHQVRQPAHRKVPAYRLKPMKGGDAKSVFLRLGPSPRYRFYWSARRTLEPWALASALSGLRFRGD